MLGKIYDDNKLRISIDKYRYKYRKKNKYRQKNYMYEVKQLWFRDERLFVLPKIRSSRPEMFFCKKVSLEISQHSQENTCARVSFLINLSTARRCSDRIPFKTCDCWYICCYVRKVINSMFDRTSGIVEIICRYNLFCNKINMNVCFRHSISSTKIVNLIEM